MKAFASFSGGKESVFSLYRAMEEGITVSCFVNMVSEDGNRCRAHGIDAGLIRLQAEAMRIPIVQRPATWEEYESEFKKIVGLIKNEEIEAGIFGDIDLEEHRQWVERVCREVGVCPIEPLWGRPREELLAEFIEAGFQAVVIAVQAQHFGEEWLGRAIDNEFIDEVSTLANVDLCGEKGEFHTLVVDGPCFAKRLSIGNTGTVLRDGYRFLNITRFTLDDK